MDLFSRAHLTLDGRNRVLGVGDGLALCDLATRRSPVLVKPTTDGVVRAPSAFAMTTGSPPSITATQLLVVPKSIPMILLINKTPFKFALNAVNVNLYGNESYDSVRRYSATTTIAWRMILSPIL